jgi:transcriptional regulator with XRE-family HTH domain
MSKTRRNKKVRVERRPMPVFPDSSSEVMIDGKDIQHIRIDLELEQSELAQAMGIATATLSRIENNKNPMSRPYYRLLRYTVRDIERLTGRKCQYEFHNDSQPGPEEIAAKHVAKNRK